MRVGRFCINWKVLAVLGAVGVGIFILAPNMGRSVLPLLLVAACPLSMLLMMRAMQSDRASPKTAQNEHSSSVDEIGELKARLARTVAEQDAIAREIAHMQAASLTAESEAILDQTRAGEEPKGKPAG